MHSLYVDFEEYEKFKNPGSTFREMSIAGIQELRFKRLDDAIKFRNDNDDQFTFFEGDHPQVEKYWAFINRMRESDERDAHIYRMEAKRRSAGRT